MRLYIRAGARLCGLGRSIPPGLATGPSHLLLKESTEASTGAHKHLYHIRSHEYLTDLQAGATSHEVSGEPLAHVSLPIFAPLDRIPATRLRLLLHYMLCDKRKPACGYEQAAPVGQEDTRHDVSRRTRGRVATKWGRGLRLEQGQAPPAAS